MAIHKIGRSDDNDIVLDDKSVSRRHAEIEGLGDGWYRVRDVGSSWGTFVLEEEGWQQIEDAEIHIESRIRFGEHSTTIVALLDSSETAEGAGAAAQPDSAPAAKPRQPDRSEPTGPEEKKPLDKEFIIAISVAGVVLILALIAAIAFFLA